MKKVMVLFGVILGLIVVASAVVLFSEANDSQNSTDLSEQIEVSEVTNSDQPQEQSSKNNSYTKDQVSQHSSINDCWTIINNNVYDLSSYVSKHPGGDDISRACGTDATTLFNSRQTESGSSIGSGTPHSSNAESQLNKLLIGNLAN